MNTGTPTQEVLPFEEADLTGMTPILLLAGEDEEETVDPHIFRGID